MGETNPRLLAVILDDLQQELTRWATVAGDTLATASFTQKHAEERVDQAHRHAAITNDKAINDREAVEQVSDQIEVLLSKSIEAKQLSHQTLTQAIAAFQGTQKTLSLWQIELEYALAWLARAEERVRRAEIELAAAESQLRNAQSELSRAESSYRSCINYRDDKGNRRDCSGEASRVRRAEQDVYDALARVKAAQLELLAAQAERERARARVRCCQTAVGLATKALEAAQQAKERATMAVNASERSLETAQAAQRFENQAIQKIIEEEMQADEMLKDVQMAANFTSEGQHYFRNAERSEESAQRLRIITRTELDNRILLLYQLNKPDLGIGGNVSSGGNYSGSNVGSMGSIGKSKSSFAMNDQTFSDNKGHNLTVRSHKAGDSFYLRVYDNGKTTDIPRDTAGYGDGGRANLHLERDEGQTVVRAKLQDIFIEPDYRSGGTGSRVLNQAEELGRTHGAKEIYGIFNYEQGQESRLRKWYTDNGYSFRKEGIEVFKKL